MIIRQDNPESVRVESAEAFQFEDLQQKADAYLNRVREQALEIQKNTQSDLEAWRQNTINLVEQETNAMRQEAKTIYDKAYQEGYEKGFDKGLEEAQADIQSTVKQHLDERLDKAFPAIDAALDQLEAKQKQWATQWETYGIELALAVAQKIIRSELKIDSTKILPALREAIELTSKAHTIRIRLSKEDYDTLLPEINALVERFQRAGKTEIVVDQTLLPGDSLVETQMGEIDLQIRSQLDRIEEELI